MNNIEWKNGTVCYVSGHQYSWDDKIATESGFGSISRQFHKIIEIIDFQLNEIREGDFIPASELDTEQKYNEVVEVFGLFGFPPYLNHNLDRAGFCSHGINNNTGLIIHDGNSQLDYGERLFDVPKRKRQLTYSQVIAIGKLKRMMLESEKSAPKKATDLNTDKSKQAYDILKSLDYEYDLVKQKWFKKVYINE